MNNLKIIEHQKPQLKMPEFKVDVPLSDKLNNDPILKYMNKTFFAGFIGKKGSGKTSIIISWLQTKNKWKKLFYQIFVFMPETSRNSIKNSVFEKLPNEQLYNALTFENLNDVYEKITENANNNKFSLIIFDDVLSYFKNKEIEQNVLHLINNARHLRTCICIASQNWNKIPRNIRINFDDIFLFNLSKTEYKNIFEDWVEIDEKEWEDILNLYYKEKMINSHSFIFGNAKNKFYINYKEIVFD